MIPQTKISKETIIGQDVGTQLLDSWFVFYEFVPFQETSVQFDDLSESQMLGGRLV